MIHPISVFIICYFVFIYANEEPPPDTTRVVGGVKVGDRSYVPYQASLRHYKQHICGASIIDEQHVLTAAHCCFDEKKKIVKTNSLMVVVGDLNLKMPTKNTVKATVKNIFTHPKYSHEDLSNDIAVLRIEKTFGTWNDYVKPINISQNLPPVGTKCYVSGWGKLNHTDEKDPDDLYIVDVPIISHSDCKYYYPGIIKSGMFCAGYREGKKDSCQGDSGGPFVCNDKLVGVVSWGYQCAIREKPGVYTDVSKYMDWVKEQQMRSSSRSISSSSMIFIVFSLTVGLLIQRM